MTERHPPADRRCQIYVQVTREPLGGLNRCSNMGTHWVRWAYPTHTDPDSDLDEEDLWTWECDAAHTSAKEAA